MKCLFRRKERRADIEEAFDEARLMNAEHEVRQLVDRADAAVKALKARRERNHWRESIEQMISGTL